MVSRDTIPISTLGLKHLLTTMALGSDKMVVNSHYSGLTWTSVTGHGFRYYHV